MQLLHRGGQNPWFQHQQRENTHKHEEYRSNYENEKSNDAHGSQKRIGVFQLVSIFHTRLCEENKKMVQLTMGSGRKGNEKINWTADHQMEFENIKAEITQHPILGTFDDSNPTFLYVDTSAEAVGAMLAQENCLNGTHIPISFYSERLKPRNRHLSSLDHELIGLSMALKHYCH